MHDLVLRLSGIDLHPANKVFHRVRGIIYVRMFFNITTWVMMNVFGHCGHR